MQQNPREPHNQRRLVGGNILWDLGKQRLNEVMDALEYEFVDYPNLAQEAKARVKRKMIASIMEQEAIIMIEAKKGKAKTKGDQETEGNNK
jgi:Cu/Ag efflux pump CusA